MENSRFSIIHILETLSTNSFLRDQLSGSDISEGMVVCADFQTAGRGLMNNRWESERSKNLLFSFLLLPHKLPINRQFILSQAISLGIWEVLSGYTEGFSIKWPNDIYWKDKKIAGILIENDLCGKHIVSTICGIGLNVNQALFVSDAPNPISLCTVIGKSIDRNQLLYELLTAIFNRYEEIKYDRANALHLRYMQALYRREGIHLYEDKSGIFSASIASIAETGHLTLRTTEGEVRSYAFKEVSFK